MIKAKEFRSIKEIIELVESGVFDKEFANIEVENERLLRNAEPDISIMHIPFDI